MAHIIKKRIKGNTYYYARECQRVDGKIKTVWQMYLGSTNSLIKMKKREKTPDTPQKIHLLKAGAAAALYSIAEEVGICKMIDDIVPKRTQGPTVGQYMVVAAINRCIHPCGKLSIPEWLDETPLPRWLKQKSDFFDSQGFWNNMRGLDAKAIRAIEETLTPHVTHMYDVNIRAVLYDETNYFTYINSFNEHCSLPQRGRNKQNRTDLRQVGLALLVDAESQLPLFHDVYEGNRDDHKEFYSVVDEMAERMKALRNGDEGITLIMDKGHTGADNVQKMSIENNMHFISSLRPSDNAELLKIPQSKYTLISGRDGWKAHRMQKDVFGVPCTIVITYNDDLYIKQLKVLWREIEKAKNKLSDLKKRLSVPHKKGRPFTKEGVENSVAGIIRAQHMKKVFTTHVFETSKGVQLKYQFKPSAVEKLKKELFGKNILFTNQHDWSTEDIITAYHEQTKIEDVFRLSKSAHGVSWYPLHHWTDHNIRVHAFYCIIGLLLMGILRMKLRAADIDISCKKAIHYLQNIEEVALIYPNGKSHIATNTLNSIQEKMYSALNLKKWLVPLS